MVLLGRKETPLCGPHLHKVMARVRYYNAPEKSLQEDWIAEAVDEVKSSGGEAKT